ncbi:alkaline phosphatase D family protein [Pseudomonas fluorescens]|uniref:alkaline phosphatase D family protein n=1 Tax=Pseudomonas fluorescens TaxID=294 RepID=UPI003523F4A3
MIKPTVGPIMGHTTADHTRIFLRGGPGRNAPAFAGLRYRRSGEAQWSRTVFSELSPARDLCNVFILNPLDANAGYEYQAGWFCPPTSAQCAQTLNALPLQWPQEIYRFKTQADTPNGTRAYIVGSCRYLRMTAGVPWLPHLGDRIFAAINHLAERAAAPIDALLMIGDQVYVDDLNIIAPDREYQDILHKYRTAFSQPHIARLMSAIPTYMILDDHEIEDNWPARKCGRDDHLYNNAIAAYELYQASHSPAHELLEDGRINRHLERYWYPFTHGDIGWFVTDSRTRRNLSAGHRRILDEEQEAALCDWLIHSPARVKFVVTSVMFYPDRRRRGEDAWQAFPEQRLRLLETIRTHRVKNVFFVSGDVHGSLTSRLTHSEDPDFEIHTIVSSPLCNSRLLPYARASTFTLDQPLARTLAGEYRHQLTGAVISQDNFAHLQVEAQQLRVTYHDRCGQPLQTLNITLR